MELAGAFNKSQSGFTLGLLELRRGIDDPGPTKPACLSSIGQFVPLTSITTVCMRWPTSKFPPSIANAMTFKHRKLPNPTFTTVIKSD